MLTRSDRAKLAGRAAMVNRAGPVRPQRKPTRRMYAAPAASCARAEVRRSRIDAASPRSASTSSSSVISSSSSSTEERSEDYVPLTSMVICSCPVRQTGPVSPRTLSTYTSAEAKEQDSSSDLSLSEAPLLPVVVHNRVKRIAAPVQPSDFTASSVRSAVPSSVSSESLSVQVQQKRAIRRHGPTRGDFLDAVQEVQQEVPAKADTDEDEPAMPLQAQVLMNIVRRLRDCPHEVTLEALSVVDWQDDNYQAVLEPLRAVYAYMEAIATKKARLRNIPLQQQHEYEAKMKEAINALPSEKAMVALVRRVASRPIVNAHSAQDAVARTRLERAPGIVMRVSQKRRASEGLLLSSASVGSAAAAVKESAVCSRPVEMRRLGDSALLSSVPAPCLGKEGILVEPAAKTRHARRSPNRSTSFSIIPDVEAEHEEIVETKEDMAPQPQAGAGKGSNAAATFEKKARKHRRHRSMSRLGSSVSFVAAPDEEGEECPESNAEQGLVARRTPLHNGKVTEVPLLTSAAASAHAKAATQAGSAVAAAVAGVATVAERQLRRGAAQSTRREHSHAEAATKTHHKQRHGDRFKGSRSCSFSEIEMEEAKEIKEDEDDDRLARTGPAAAAAARTTPALAQTRRAQGGTTASATASETQKRPARPAPRRETDVELPVGTRVEDEEVSIKPRARGAAHASGVSPSKQSRRRHVVHRNRELSVSHLEDMKSGEIVEKNAETAIGHSKAPGDAINMLLPSGQDDNLAQTRSSLRSTRARNTPKMVLAPSAKDEEDDDNVTLDESPHKGHGVAHRKKRRPRRHGMHELSVSALPDEEAGEIREADTDSLYTGTTTSASAAYPSRLTTGGSLSTAVRQRPASGTARRTLPPIGSTSRASEQRSSASPRTPQRPSAGEARPRAAAATVKSTR